MFICRIEIDSCEYFGSGEGISEAWRNAIDNTLAMWDEGDINLNNVTFYSIGRENEVKAFNNSPSLRDIVWKQAGN